MKGIHQTKRLFNAYNPKFTGGSYAGNVYDPGYLSPALNTMGGGGRQPFILECYEVQVKKDRLLYQAHVESTDKRSGL